MAQKIQVILYDDLTGDEIRNGGTVRFGYAGSDYEIDLNDYHHDQLVTILEPYMNAARLVLPEGVKRPAPRTAASRALRAAQREWGKRQGFKVGDRGRIPVAVIRAYKAAH